MRKMVRDAEHAVLDAAWHEGFRAVRLALDHEIRAMFTRYEALKKSRTALLALNKASK